MNESNKRVLVTGAEGFLGKFVLHVLSHLQWNAVQFRGDLRDEKVVHSFITENSPYDFVIHLASISHPAECEKNPELATAVNVGGTKNLLEALAHLTSKPWLLFFSTAQVYVPSEFPVTETNEVAATTVYTRTKLQGEQLIEKFSKTVGIPSTVFRLFNHSHHSQTNLYFLPSVYEKLKKLDVTGEVPVGNLNLVRDFSSVQDFQRNMLQFLSHARPPEPYEVLNWCSGRPYSLEKLANALAVHLGKKVEWLQNVTIKDKSIPGKIVGDPAAFAEKVSFRVTHQNEGEFIHQFLSESLLKF